MDAPHLAALVDDADNTLSHLRPLLRGYREELREARELRRPAEPLIADLERAGAQLRALAEAMRQA